MLYVDASSYDDYDRVVRYLIENDIKMGKRNKMQMVVEADMSMEQFVAMRDSVAFDDLVTAGEKPFEPILD